MEVKKKLSSKEIDSVTKWWLSEFFFTT